MYVYPPPLTLTRGNQNRSIHADFSTVLAFDDAQCNLKLGIHLFKSFWYL